MGGWRLVMARAMASPVESASNPQWTEWHCEIRGVSQEGFGVAPAVEIHQ